MGDTVYADLLFLINFSMDFLCFYIVARLSRSRLCLWRTAIASALGGVYAVAALFITCGAAAATVIDIIVLLLMCAAAMAARGMSLRRLLGQSLLYAGVSAAMGGIMTALYTLLNKADYPREAVSGSGDGVSLWTLALLAAAAAAAALAGGRQLRLRAAAKRADVIITQGDRSVRLHAMTDSGNLLTDPLAGRQVIICELDAVAALFPDGLVEIWRGGDASAAAALPHEYAAMLRFLPAEGALTGDRSLLAAVRPDRVELERDVFERRGGNSAPVEVDVLLAPLPRRIRAGGCTALLPPGLI